MQLILHLGAHGTDEGRIAAWIARNRETFEGQGIAVPAPSLFLARLSAALDQGRDADPRAREEALLRGLGASGARQRMLVSAPGLLGSAADVLAADGFYVRDVARRLHALQTLFGRTRIVAMLAVRRAGGIIPPLWPDDSDAGLAPIPALADDTLPWARLVATIRRQLPRAGVLAWRHEDWSRVWPQVLDAMVGPGRVLPSAGLFDLAAIGLGAEARLRAGRYVAAHPPSSAGHLRRVIEAFDRRYPAGANPSAARDLPGWLPPRLRELDAGYATEWGDLAGLTGVRVLSPQGIGEVSTRSGA